MTDLTITLTGEVRESNFEEWKDGLVERIRAVDVEPTGEDDFASANEDIRELRAAERTLKDAKRAALEQAAEINRLFDAVDAVAEETRQARLALERRIRTRRQEVRQRALQAHVDVNAATLDALPAARQVLFQDRAALLALPSDELERTIAHRVELWRETMADPDAHAIADASAGPDVSSRDGDRRVPDATDVARMTDETQPSDESTTLDDGATGTRAAVGTDTDEKPRAWRVTIDLSAPRSKAEQLFARVRERWKGDRAVTDVDLSTAD